MTIPILQLRRTIVKVKIIMTLIIIIKNIGQNLQNTKNMKKTLKTASILKKSLKKRIAILINTAMNILSIMMAIVKTVTIITGKED